MLSNFDRSDADPAALSDYIIALLKHEKPPAELKSFCTSQLTDFLHSNSLFRRIEGVPEEIVMIPPPREVEPPKSSREDHRMKDSKSYSDEEDRGHRHRREHERNRSRSPRGRYEERRPHPSRREYQRDHRGGKGPSYGMIPPGMMESGHRGMRQQRRYQQPLPQSRSETRLVIDRIPPEFCSISMVNDYFKTFGNIVNITVQPEMQRARIEFSTNEEAKSAYNSPKVIFENRFVKVFWDQEGLPAASVVRQSMQPASRPNHIESNSVNARTEALQKKQDALKGMLELQKQKQELLQRYISQQKELLTKLENRQLPEAERQEILKALRGIDELIKSLHMSSSSTEGSPIQKPAVMMADEITSSSDQVASLQTTPILRGGPVVRGRGRGRGGAFATRAAHRLDLRPTAFLMKPVPSRVGKDIGSIRKLYEPYGEIKNITLCEDVSGVIVSFLRRADAEKAYFYLPKADLGEPFDLEWIASTISPALASSEEAFEMPDHDHIPLDAE